jgi:uncharacterized protein (DUF1697 family)
MARYIAFLRAINVGGRTVKMDRLRELFEAMKFKDVSTFIASGNVIFDAPGKQKDTAALERRIEEHLARSLGYEVATLLRTPAELAAVAAYAPFPSEGPQAESHRLYVILMRDPLADEARDRLLALRTQADDLHVHGREVYWLCRVPFADSPLAKAPLEKILGMPSTTRNVTTLRKMAAKYGPGGCGRDRRE